MSELRIPPGTEECFELLPGTQYVYDDKGIIAVVNFTPEGYGPTVLQKVLPALQNYAIDKQLIEEIKNG